MKFQAALGRGVYSIAIVDAATASECCSPVKAETSQSAMRAGSVLRNYSCAGTGSDSDENFSAILPARGGDSFEPQSSGRFCPVGSIVAGGNVIWKVDPFGRSDLFCALSSARDIASKSGRPEITPRWRR